MRKLFAFIRKLFISHTSAHQTDKKHLNLNQYHNNTYQIDEVLLLADEDREVVLDDGPDLKSAQTRIKAKLPYRVKN